MQIIHRKTTKKIAVGKVSIGGDAPVSVQSMWKSPYKGDDDIILKSLNEYRDIGCDIIRFAVPSLETARGIGSLCGRTGIPIVADIHFDYKIALECLDYPFAKIRINPGNIGSEWKVREVAGKAADKNIPIRIGVNGGSLPEKFRTMGDVADAMVQSAAEEIAVLEKMQFDSIIVSLKSSDIETTVRANRLFAEQFSYPLHIGITEAGPGITGIVQNSIGISRLLRGGIGNTLRVSLSGSVKDEIIAGREILCAENMYDRGLRIISCPQCGRSTFDVRGFLESMGSYLYTVKKNKTIAVMGCPVNGLEEARHADLGITGFGNTAVIFKYGKELRKISMDESRKVFLKELDKLE